MDMRNKSVWELTAIKKSLSKLELLNTPEEQQRLIDAKRELRRRHGWKLLQIIKLPLTLMDIFFPDATIKVVKQISLLCSTNNLNPTTTEEF